MKKGLRPLVVAIVRKQRKFESRPYEEGIKTGTFPPFECQLEFESRPYEEGIKT